MTDPPGIPPVYKMIKLVTVHNASPPLHFETECNMYIYLENLYTNFSNLHCF